jgi:hypothetical protein
MPDKQEENRNELGQWGKGTSGNPGGRPKGSVGLTRRIRELLLADRGKEKQIADLLVESMVKEALKNPAKMWSFIKEFIDRDEGRTDRRDIISHEDQTVADDVAAQIRSALEAMKASVPDDEVN